MAVWEAFKTIQSGSLKRVVALKATPNRRVYLQHGDHSALALTSGLTGQSDYQMYMAVRAFETMQNGPFGLLSSNFHKRIRMAAMQL